MQIARHLCSCPLARPESTQDSQASSLTSFKLSWPAKERVCRARASQYSIRSTTGGEAGAIKAWMRWNLEPTTYIPPWAPILGGAASGARSILLPRLAG